VLTISPDPALAAGAQKRAARARFTVVPAERVALPARALLIAEILVAYVRVRLWLRRLQFESVVAKVRAGEPVCHADREPGSWDTRLIGFRLGNAVNRTLRLLPTDSRCLSQSLVLSKLLADRSIQAKLIIGAHSAPDFEAHAWVEYHGKPLLPTEGFQDSRLVEV
jgi:hypothetical protein